MLTPIAGCHRHALKSIWGKTSAPGPIRTGDLRIRRKAQPRRDRRPSPDYMGQTETNRDKPRHANRPGVSVPPRPIRATWTASPGADGHTFGHGEGGTKSGCPTAVSGGASAYRTIGSYRDNRHTALSVKAGPSSMLDNPVAVVVHGVAEVCCRVDKRAPGLGCEVTPARGRT
jgi:hypothetical protein